MNRESRLNRTLDQSILNNILFNIRLIKIHIYSDRLISRLTIFIDSVDIDGNIFDDDTDDKKILTQYEIDKLQIMFFNENCKITDCGICLDEFQLNDKLLCLKCKHIFHYSCVHKWLTNGSNRCPSCRVEQN